MKDIKNKVQLIFIPFLIIAIGFIGVYTFLHWAIFLESGLPIKDDVVTFWLPFVLPFIPVFIWLSPRLKLLHFKRENALFGYQFLACLAIAVPTIIAQSYLKSATGKLTTIEDVSQIEKSEKTRYYALDAYYVDKKHVSVQHKITPSGSNNGYSIFVYVAMPIFRDRSETSNTECKYWLGKKYKKQVTSNRSDEENEQIFRQFISQSEREFDQTDFSNFQYLEVLGNTDDRDEFNKAIEQSAEVKGVDPIVFEAHTAPFENRKGNNMEWVLASLCIGFLAYFILLIFPKFDEKRLTGFKNGKLEKDTDLQEALAFFIPKDGFFITPILIDLNILVFIAMVLAGFGMVTFNSADLLNWGANYRPLTTDGQWWRLLTSTFMHSGLMHLFANMYALIFVGTILEPFLGKTKYLFLYLLTGILASVASIWWYDAAISVGASGAIFGLYGFFLAILLLKKLPADVNKAFLTSTLVFVGFNLLMGFTGGIDNAAHIGGLVGGFLLGIVSQSFGYNSKR